MNLLEGGKGGEGRMGERGWGGDGGRVGREGGEGTWGREGYFDTVNANKSWARVHGGQSSEFPIYPTTLERTISTLCLIPLWA